MKFRYEIWSILLLLFVAGATNHAWACGGGDDHHSGKFSPKKESRSHSINDDDQATKECAGECSSDRKTSGCPCDHEHGGCTCPDCGTAGFSSTLLALATGDKISFSILSASVQKQAFYFANQLPEAVYLAIWQPPEVSA